MKFDPIDIFLFAGILIAVTLGYRGGFTKKLLNILALITAIMVGVFFMGTTGGFFEEVVLLDHATSYVLGFGLIVSTIMVTAILLYKRFGSQGMAKSGSQIAGVILGLFEGLMVISLLLMMLKVFDMPDKQTEEHSLLYKPMYQVAPTFFVLMRPYLPGAHAFQDRLSATFKDTPLFGEKPDPDDTPTTRRK